MYFLFFFCSRGCGTKQAFFCWHWSPKGARKELELTFSQPFFVLLIIHSIVARTFCPHTSDMTTVATRRRKRSSNTDWKADFYRNGYPAEVIVIEDSPTPTPDQLNTHTNNQQQNHVSTYTTPPAASTRSKRPRRKVTSAYQQQLPQTSQISYPVLTPVTSLVGNFTQPAAKRRRKENGEAAVYPEGMLTRMASSSTYPRGF
jgi:hypothetical protein